MAYSKKTWSNGEVITEAALNNIENGVAANDAAVAKKAKKAAAIEAADAAQAAGENVTKAEFDKAVTLINACKAKINEMNA